MANMRLRRLRFLKLGIGITLAAIICLAGGMLFAARSTQEYLVYIGTYTGPKSKGIYGLRFDSNKGRLQEVGLVGEVPQPSGDGTINPSPIPEPMFSQLGYLSDADLAEAMRFAAPENAEHAH